MNRKGHFYIIAAPSGAGKTSLVDALAESLDHVSISVSYTTRPSRPNEVNGVNYYFVNDTTFDEMIMADRFLEHAIVFGYRYGTARDKILSQLEAGIDVMLEIDWQGAREISRQFPDAVSIFILPPSMEVLQKRLFQRNQDDATVIKARMAAAQQEISHFKEFQYLIVNDDFKTALHQLACIIQANRLKMAENSRVYSKLLAELLEKK